MFNLENTKYKVKVSNTFKKQFKKILKQGKSEDKFLTVLGKLANGCELDEKYQNHTLQNSKHFKNCNELHIEPDWLLVYQYINDSLILLLVETGSHSDLF